MRVTTKTESLQKHGSLKHLTTSPLKKYSILFQKKLSSLLDVDPICDNRLTFTDFSHGTVCSPELSPHCFLGFPQICRNALRQKHLADCSQSEHRSVYLLTGCHVNLHVVFPHVVIAPNQIIV